MDVGGNLYGVATNSGEVQQDQVVFEIFKRTPDGQVQDFARYGLYFDAEFGVVVDTQGILYGTTAFCGANGLGTVWQFTGFPELSP